MFVEALTFGGRVSLVATFAPSLLTMTAEFDAMASHMCLDATLIPVYAEGAFDALSIGLAAKHYNLIARAAEKLHNCSTIMRAQFCMASVAKTVESWVFSLVLTSPNSAVRGLKG